MARSSGDAFLDSLHRIPLTVLITAVNLGVFLLCWLRGDARGVAADPEVLLKLGSSVRYYIQAGDYWRLLTAVFLHASWIHVLVNCVFMFGWCAAIERSVGSAWFAFAYLTTGVGSFAFSSLCKLSPSVGASGAGYGMIAVTMAMIYRREGGWDNFMANPFVRSIFSQAVFWIFIGFFMFRRMDHYAHIGGLVFGVFCGLILERRRGRHEMKWKVSLAAYILVWLGLIVLACIPGMGFGDYGD